MEGYGNENPGAFQPTRPLRGATKVAHADWLRVPAISTHAPLAGRDGCGMTCCTHTTNFNPRAPCGARLTPRRSRCYRIGNFNPRAPCGARQRSGANRRAARYFNPRAPCGARLNWLTVYELKPDISTHAPLAGRDACRRPSLTLRWNFNPRAPCGARQQKSTNHYAHFCDNRQISDAFAQNAACQGILLLFDAGKPCGFWVRTAQVISARLCFAL